MSPALRLDILRRDLCSSRRCAGLLLTSRLAFRYNMRGIKRGQKIVIPIPHVDVLCPQLADRLKQNGDKLSVDLRIFLRLLDTYISLWPFDEEWYLRTYPEVRQAILDGHFSSAWNHFRGIGYFEGRFPFEPSVDGSWYLATYPDVANAMVKGVLSDAREHFLNFGYKEGRMPRPPAVQPEWYAPRYMPQSDASKNDAAACTDHFVRHGYLSGAIPSRPR
jgi:hypothetical protein